MIFLSLYLNLIKGVEDQDDEIPSDNRGIRKTISVGKTANSIYQMIYNPQ